MERSRAKSPPRSPKSPPKTAASRKTSPKQTSPKMTSGKMRPLKTQDEALIFKLLEVRCRTCKKPLGNYETKINEMREEGYSDLQIFETLGIKRTCCRNAISNPIPISLAEYIGPETQLHLLLEEPSKKASKVESPEEKEISPPKTKSAVDPKKRVSELMNLANSIKNASKEEPSKVKKPIRYNVAV